MDALLTEFAKRCAQADGSDIPKYKRLMKVIQDAMESGILSPGDRLPTEQAIANAVPYALGTVQKALNALVTRGLVRRNRRSGTFVSEPARPLDDTSQFDFKRVDGTEIGEILSEITEISTTDDRRHALAVLGDCPSGYIKIKRLDRIDSDFRCYVEIHLCANRFSKLLTKDRKYLSGRNIRTILWTQFGLSVTSLDIASRAVIASAEVAGELNIGKASVVQQTEITGLDVDRNPLYTQTTYAPVGDYLLTFRKEVN